jgi:lipoate-protein ligase B
LVEYQEAWALQRRLVEACRETGEAHLLLLEHPPTYTFGVRGRQEHLLLSEEALASLGATVHRVDRGGDVTFHGPGQLVAYPILDLRRWGQGPLWYVRSLEAVLIEALAAFDIQGERRPGRPGVWVGDAKIAAIGVHVSRGITSHGFALNVDPDLRYFSYIIPCGLPDVSVTSMAQVLRNSTIHGAALQAGQKPPLSSGGGETVPSMDAVVDAVADAFARVFNLDTQQHVRRGDHPVALGGRLPATTLR